MADEHSDMAWTESGYRPRACGKAVLLVGNGLNWAGSGPSWSHLLVALKQEAKFSAPLDEATPFPLLYEEIYLHGRRRGVEEATLLRCVASHTDEIPVTPLLQRLRKLPVKHLLTTNYDLATELAFLGAEGRSRAPIAEQRYSLFRRREVDGRVLWPIHGEARKKKSIMLGYDHYSGYLEQMRRYVTRGVRYQRQSHPSLVKALGKAGGLDLVRSWVDFFFTKHVIILGLSLDVQEAHLWWLLTYKARRRAEGKKFASHGKVTFIHGPLPDPGDPPDPEVRERRLRMVRVHRLLRAAGVDLKEVRTQSPSDRAVHFELLPETWSS